MLFVVDLLPATLDALVRVFGTHEYVSAAYVFGSRVGGQSRPDSDLDMGVLYRTPQPLETTLTLEAELQATVDTKIDVVDAARAATFLALDIVRGERVLARDVVEADRFELYVRRRAGDLLPFERQRQALLVRAS